MACSFRVLIIAASAFPRGGVAVWLDYLAAGLVRIGSRSGPCKDFVKERRIKALGNVMDRNVSTISQQIGGSFYITTSGSSRHAGVGLVSKLSGLASTS